MHFTHSGKRILIALFIVYTICLLSLLALNFKHEPQGRAVILMGLTLFAIWCLLGGYIMWRKARTNPPTSTSPVRSFIIGAIGLACIEEAIAVSITNLAPLYGVSVGSAYITASTNYFDIITMHSVIVFIPMLITLGYLLRRYDISPFQAFLLWGCIGVFAELTLAGPSVFIAAPMWIMVYGLMVYLPAHVFVDTARTHWSAFRLPLFFILMLLSAVTTAWIPAVLEHPSIHFAPID